MTERRQCPRRDDAAAHALGALTAAERAEYETHLRVCPDCLAAVREYADAAALLAFSVPSPEPPAGLRERVLSRIRAEVAGRAGPTSRRLPGWAAAAMVALAVLAGGFGWRAYQLSAEVARLRREIAASGALAALRTVALAGTEAAPAAAGAVTVIREGEMVRVVLDVTGLPPLQGGQSYQLWLIRDGQRENGGTFVVDGAGRGGVTRRFPATLQFTAAGITREPDAFGTTPRGERVMASRG